MQITHFVISNGRLTDKNKSGNALLIVAAIFVSTPCMVIGGDMMLLF